jgi:hypothetical protein
MRITRAQLVAWLSQPTTIAGLATLAGDAVLIATGAVTWRVELPIAAGSLIAVALPDNSVAPGLMIRTLRDLLAAIATRDPGSITAAVADAEALLDALE